MLRAMSPDVSRRWRLERVGMLAAVLLLAACTGTTKADVRTTARPSTTRATTTTTSTTTTSTTSTIPPETVPPETTVPPWMPPPIPVPVLGPDGQPLPEPPVVWPAASWIAPGVPAPGSMFDSLNADRSLDGLGPVVALTFDDGPTQYTQQIVDILKFNLVPATFFQLTPQSLARQDLVRSMLADGFRLGVHTKHHVDLDEAFPFQQIDEIAGSVEQLESVVGPGVVKCFRPPYGSFDQYVIDVASSKGLATSMWTLDTLDWQKPD